MDDTTNNVMDSSNDEITSELVFLAEFIHNNHDQRIELSNLYSLPEVDNDVSSKFIKVDIGRGEEDCIPYIAIIKNPDSKETEECTNEEIEAAKDLHSKGVQLCMRDSSDDPSSATLERIRADLDSDSLIVYWLPWKDMMCRLTLGVNGFMRMESDGNMLILPSKLVLSIP